MTKIKHWKRTIFESKKRLCMPIMTHPGIEMTGRTIKDAVSDGKIHYEAVQLLSQRFPSAAATTMMDLSVEAELFGSEIYFSDNDVPVVIGKIVSTREAIEKLELPELNQGRFPHYLAATSMAVKHINDRPVFAGCIGPFSLAGRLFDLTELMMAILTDPDSSQLLIQKCTRFLEKYIQEFKNVGADGIILAEPSAGMLSPLQCEEFSSRHVRKLVDQLQDDDFIIILHNCGNTEPLLDSLQNTGAAGIHLGNRCPIDSALKRINPQTLVFGNLDPVTVLKEGTANDVREKTLDILNRAADFNNFVLSSGCDVSPQTPFANIKALFIALDEFHNRQ